MDSKFKINDAVKFINSSENKYTYGDEAIIDNSFERNDKFFYNVKSAGHLISDVPEEDIEFVYSGIDRNVDLALRERDKTKSFKDSDVRVSGSRKELLIYKGLINFSDLENIEKDAVIARALIKKDKVYPKINTNEQIDKGVSGGSLFLKMKARDFIASNPPDTAEFRALYVGLSEWLYQLLDEAITLNDFEERRKLFINGIIRKSILIANPEMENELILQNKEYQEQVDLEQEYIDKGDKLDDKMNQLAKEANIMVWDWDKKKSAFPELYKEYDYWKKLQNVARQFIYNKILPLEYKFLHKLYVVEGSKKISLLTSKDISSGIYEESDYDYMIKYSDKVRKELIKSVFGDKFYMFIAKNHRTGKEATYKVYEDAKQYEAFTQEEYNNIYESKIKSIEEDIIKYTNHIEFLDDPEKTYREKVDYGLANGMGTWYWISNRKRNFAVMVKRGDIDDAIRLMKSVVNDPNSGYQKKIEGYKYELDELNKKYFVRENNYAFLDKEDKECKKGERAELIVNSSQPLSYIKRTNGVAVYDTDLDTNDKILSFYKNILGITRITYGLSLPDSERSAHALRYAEAMLDLAETLNWDVKYLTNLDKTQSLGILFAAAGRGKAMAHFSPDINAINLTRSNGDGSVAHEMMHGIDHAIAKTFPNQNKSEKNHAVFASYTKGGSENVSNKNIQNAFSNLMNFITSGVYITKNNEFDDTKISKEHPVTQKIIPLLPEFVQSVLNSFVTIKFEKNNKIPSFQKFDTIEEYIKYLNEYLPRYLNYDFYLTNKSDVQDTLGAILNQLKLDKYEFNLSNKPYSRGNVFGQRSSTILYKSSSALKSPYWTFHWELMARSFECFIEDTMAKNNMSNNYLVSGVYFNNRYGVYPFGLERTLINIFIQNVMDTIKEELSIPDFKPFREARTDTYLELGEDGDGEENILVIDEKTKDIIEEESKEREIGVNKLKKLLELLSKKETMEEGGELNVNSNKLVESLFSFK